MSNIKVPVTASTKKWLNKNLSDTPFKTIEEYVGALIELERSVKDIQEFADCGCPLCKEMIESGAPIITHVLDQDFDDDMMDDDDEEGNKGYFVQVVSKLPFDKTH
ncbi:hypothetical protein [Glaciecola sp. 1036]|uniref:hypothetical protein n=1 Tax=Alteromonadaceae TaxID=72275 RepID=UPI003CFD37A8